jgi:CheY-like chemotaxis protein
VRPHPRQRLVTVAHRLRAETHRTLWPPGLLVDDRPAVLAVHYHALEHLARLLVSLLRVVGREALHSVTVVDNGSSCTDRAVLEALEEAGLIQLVAAQGSTGHGAGLNAGLSAIARRASAAHVAPEHVWILDNDVIVLRPDVIVDAVAAARASGAAAVGEIQHGVARLPEGYAHVSSLLIRPEAVWRRSVAPFLDDGEPGAEQQRSIRRRGLAVGDFPFFAEGYLLHLGQGSLRGVVDRGDKTHRMFGWAAGNYEFHYHGHPRGAELHRAALDVLHRELPSFGPAAVVDACTRADPLRIPEPPRRG